MTDFTVHTSQATFGWSRATAEELERFLLADTDARAKVRAALDGDCVLRFTPDEKRDVASVLNFHLETVSGDLEALRHTLIDDLHDLDRRR